MEDTVLSVGKSVLNGALGYAKSVVAEEVALQLGVRRDQAFITDELEMMQGFLMTAHDERDDNKVVKIWVKQVRDVAYDVEDCLVDFAVRLQQKSWWRISRTLLDRRHVAMQMKELRAKVEDVSQRNTRYNLIRGSSSKTATVAEESAVTAAAIFGMNEARRAAKQDNAKVDLFQLINNWTDNELRVIAVWGTSADLGQTSIINAAYESSDIKSKFPCRAWVRVMHPFNPKEFIQSLVEQFHASVGVDVLLEEKKWGRELAEEFKGYVNEKKYLIVLTDLSTIEEWNRIKQCFPDNQKGSRILVLTIQAEFASLCAGQESIVSELKQLSADQTIYAFHNKGFQDAKYLTKTRSSSNKATTSTDNSSFVEISEDQPNDVDEKVVVKKTFTRMRTTVTALEESHLVGRKKEKSEIIKLILSQPTQQFQVISIWGMGGLGKTTLIMDIYESQELGGTFEKRACVTIRRPFILDELLRSLVMQLDTKTSEKLNMVGLSGGTNKTIRLMPRTELINELVRLLQGKRCLIVLDNISCTAEWNQIMPSLPEMEITTRIMVTTRKESVARHCSTTQENIYHLELLKDKDGRDLFIRKVFKETMDMDKHTGVVEQADIILKKCNRLPLAIVTIGGFLANQPKTVVEWRKLNEHMSAELEMNPELEPIRMVLMKSYDGLPFHLKSCFLYMPIFSEDLTISRRRLVRRWVAEGYSREIRDKSAEEVAEGYFLDLINRSMILPSKQSIHTRKGIDSCQVHDLMREIAISKSIEENLVLRLDEGSSTNTKVIARHLAISRDWKGDQSEFDSTVDLSRVRSITVFGKWKPFFISDKMRLLRVLDLEGSFGLVDHHLEHIGNLLHLRYLSLRGCDDIFHLPDSFGNLGQLETLDVMGTSIVKLPRTITSLSKLHHIIVGCVRGDDEDPYETICEDLPKQMRNNLCLTTLVSVGFCVGCCTPNFVKEIFDVSGDMNRHDVCTACCCNMLPTFVTHRSEGGVAVPRGINKLKALQTLGLVYISGGKAALEDIKMLTRLRKLGVTGVNKSNSQEFCSAIAHLSCLESLLVNSLGKPGLSGCLDGLISPPENLQSLKLYGNLVKLPGWIEGLKNLMKLKLRSSRILEHDAAIQILGKIPNLTILRLWKESFVGEDVCLSFHEEAFPSLVVLEMDLIDLKSVRFEQGATPKLELLQYRGQISKTKSGLFGGLSSLPSLKEFMLDNKSYYVGFLEDLRGQLDMNRNGPVLKRC